MPTHRLTNAEIVNISKFMEGVILKEENGVRYRKPWSDQKIAKKFGATYQNVSYLRRSVFGEIAVPAPKPAPKPKAEPKQMDLFHPEKATKGSILTVVKDLHNLTLAHTEMIDRLTARITYLERELGVTSQDKVL